MEEKVIEFYEQNSATRAEGRRMVFPGSVVTILKSLLDAFTLVAKVHAGKERAVFKQNNPSKPHNTFWLGVVLRPLKKVRSQSKESISLVIRKSKTWGLGEAGV